MTKRTRYFVGGSAGFLMVGLTVGLAAYFGGIPGLAQPAGPQELDYVPQDAVVVAFANVRTLMDSQFRQQIKGLEPAEHQKGQDEFRDATGINIETDIDYVVGCVLPGTAADPKAGGGFVLAHGRFDQPRIEALIREKGAVEQTYKGRRVWVSRHGFDGSEALTVEPTGRRSEGMGLAFIGGEVAAIGTPGAIQRVIDLQHGAMNVRANEKLMQMIDGVDSGNAWAVGRFDVLTNQARLPRQVADQIPPITWFSATGHVNGGVSGTVSVETKDKESADNLRQVVAGLMALARLQGGSKPEVAAALQSIQLGGENNTVSVSFALPAAALDALKATGLGRHAIE